MGKPSRRKFLLRESGGLGNLPYEHFVSHSFSPSLSLTHPHTRIYCKEDISLSLFLHTNSHPCTVHRTHTHTSLYTHHWYTTSHHTLTQEEHTLYLPSFSLSLFFIHLLALSLSLSETHTHTLSLTYFLSFRWIFWKTCRQNWSETSEGIIWSRIRHSIRAIRRVRTSKKLQILQS